MDAGSNPHRGRIADLVNPYMNRTTNQGGGIKATGYEHALLWLDRHPGRWALVGEDEMGASPEMMLRAGLEVSTRGRGALVYARVPHPDGEELSEALHRGATLLEALPALQRDPFNWSPAELAEAAQIARDNLFPVKNHRK